MIDRRNFLSSLAAAAPMLFLPRIIKPTWKQILKVSPRYHITQMGFVQVSSCGGFQMLTTVNDDGTFQSTVHGVSA